MSVRVGMSKILLLLGGLLWLTPAVTFASDEQASAQQKIADMRNFDAQFDGKVDDRFLPTDPDTGVVEEPKAPSFDGKIPTGNINAIQLYSQDELIRLINKNIHLQRVQTDRCQLVRDIQARAEVLEIPSYQFLWGDMLAWGVCVQQDAELGIDYMRAAAAQGLPAALEHLGRYHQNSVLVSQDTPLAVRYLKEASALGSTKALLQLADLLIDGHGSPYDYQDVYVWLFRTVTSDKSYRKAVDKRMAALATKMSPSLIKQSRNMMKQY